ncbi:MAG: HAMP domain-containing histidine kinase, partial [Magnetococcales bacterium]|nr:HAMP domain-containing histidine kinase [Magnetococcales bacterium]
IKGVALLGVLWVVLTHLVGRPLRGLLERLEVYGHGGRDPFAELDEVIRQRLAADAAQLQALTQKIAASEQKVETLQSRQRFQLQLQNQMNDLWLHQSMERFAAHLAHEMNQPLGSIVIYAQTCAMELASDRLQPDKLKEALTRIDLQAVSVGEMIKRLRQQVEGGEPDLQPQVLTPVINEALSLLDIEATSELDNLALDLSPSPLTVLMDRVQMLQVIRHLLHNGIRAMADMEPVERRMRIVTRRTQAGGAELRIMDFGPGVSEALLGKLFEPHYSEFRQKLSMGLAVCRLVVERHGGEIVYDGNIAPGACFIIRLPLASAGLGAYVDPAQISVTGGA